MGGGTGWDGGVMELWRVPALTYSLMRAVVSFDDNVPGGLGVWKAYPPSYTQPANAGIGYTLITVGDSSGNPSANSPFVYISGDLYSQGVDMSRVTLTANASGPSTAATRAGATASVAGVTGVVLAGANYQLEISGTASNLPRIHELWVH